MRRIDHGGEILDAVHAEVGDRGGAALIFLRLEFARPGSRREILHLARNRRQRFGLGLADNRRNQSARHRHGDADVGMLVFHHAAFGPAHIAIRYPLQGNCHRLDDKIVDRKLVERLFLFVGWCGRIDLLAGGEQLADIAIDGQIVMRYGLHRRGQPLGNGPPHAVMRHDLVRAGFEQREDLLVRHRGRDARRAGHGWWRLQPLARLRLFHIARDHPAMRA